MGGKIRDERKRRLGLGFKRDKIMYPVHEILHARQMAVNTTVDCQKGHA